MIFVVFLSAMQPPIFHGIQQMFCIRWMHVLRAIDHDVHHDVCTKSWSNTYTYNDCHCICMTPWNQLKIENSLEIWHYIHFDDASCIQSIYLWNVHKFFFSRKIHNLNTIFIGHPLSVFSDSTFTITALKKNRRKEEK